MVEAFEAVSTASKEYGTTMRLAAYCPGISRVASALELRGFW